MASKTFTFRCPACGGKLQLNEENRGTTGKCDICQSTIQIPRVSPVPTLSELVAESIPSEVSQASPAVPTAGDIGLGMARSQRVMDTAQEIMAWTLKSLVRFRHVVVGIVFFVAGCCTLFCVVIYVQLSGEVDEPPMPLETSAIADGLLPEGTPLSAQATVQTTVQPPVVTSKISYDEIRAAMSNSPATEARAQKELTSAQRDIIEALLTEKRSELAENLKGQRVSWNGSVKDVTIVGESFVLLIEMDSKDTVLDSYDVAFIVEASDAVKLSKGQHIAFEGEILKVELDNFYENCIVQLANATWNMSVPPPKSNGSTPRASRPTPQRRSIAHVKTSSTVYSADNVYHFDRDCEELSGKSPGVRTEANARERGMARCSVCAPN